MAPLAPTLQPDRAFERLYRRYAGDVYRYALALLRNPADAEDATQTTFMNAYRAMQRGEEPRRPQNWLITIAHNACRKRFATAARRVKEVPLDERVASLPSAADQRPSIEGVLEALGQLPFNQRAALVMRELEGRSYNEIADTLGVTRPAVEALLFRARRSLKLSRSTLQSLGAVPLPGSLARFFQEPAVFVGGSTAAAGSGVLAKAALVVALGAVAGGGAVVETQADRATSGAAQALVQADGVPAGHSQARLLPQQARNGRVTQTAVSRGSRGPLAGTKVSTSGSPLWRGRVQAAIGSLPGSAAGAAGEGVTAAGDATARGPIRVARRAGRKVVSKVNSRPVSPPQLPVPLPALPGVEVPSVRVPDVPEPSLPQAPGLPVPLPALPRVDAPSVRVPDVPQPSLPQAPGLPVPVPKVPDLL